MGRETNNFRSPIAVLLFFGTTVIGLLLDLWTKALAVRYLASAGRTVQFIPGWLHFTYIGNPGAVFGLGQGQRPLFIAVSIAAIAFLTYLFALSGKRRFYQLLLGMLLAGVLGNMFDRIAFGYVRDMILALPGIYWPDSIAKMLPGDLAGKSVFPWIFNVADTLLCVGVFLMIVYSLFHKPDEETAPTEEMKPQMNANERG
jgi:signal peptidase II